MHELPLLVFYSWIQISRFCMQWLSWVDNVNWQWQWQSYLLRYVSHHYKTRQMCDQAILENTETIELVPDCYKNQQMCDKAVYN